MIRLEIPRRNAVCEKGGERLLPGMEIYSVILQETNGPQVKRRDFCLACWEISQKDFVQKDFVQESGVCGFWKSKIEMRKKEEENCLVDRAVSLLRKNVQSCYLPEAEIFVICLLLLRARRIAMRQEFQNEGETYRLFEILGREEFLTVKVVNLSQIQIEALQKSLADQFQLDLKN